MNSNLDNQDIIDYQEILQLENELKRFDALCECHCTSSKDIEDDFKRSSGVTLDQVLENSKIGTGCGSCKEAFQAWANRYKKLQTYLSNEG